MDRDEPYKLNMVRLRKFLKVSFFLVSRILSSVYGGFLRFLESRLLQGLVNFVNLVVMVAMIFVTLILIMVTQNTVQVQSETNEVSKIVAEMQVMSSYETRLQDVDRRIALTDQL